MQLAAIGLICRIAAQIDKLLLDVALCLRPTREKKLISAASNSHTSLKEATLTALDAVVTDGIAPKKFFNLAEKINSIDSFFEYRDWVAHSVSIVEPTSNGQDLSLWSHKNQVPVDVSSSKLKSTIQEGYALLFDLQLALHSIQSYLDRVSRFEGYRLSAIRKNKSKSEILIFTWENNNSHPYIEVFGTSAWKDHYFVLPSQAGHLLRELGAEGFVFEKSESLVELMRS